MDDEIIPTIDLAEATDGRNSAEENQNLAGRVDVQRIVRAAKGAIENQLGARYAKPAELVGFKILGSEVRAEDVRFVNVEATMGTQFGERTVQVWVPFDIVEEPSEQTIWN